jgi:uncharacterized protein YkwD
MHADQTVANQRKTQAFALGFIFILAGVCATAIKAWSQAPSAASQLSSDTAVANAGLKVLNAYRAMARLPPLKEAPALSEGDRAHAIYLVKNYAAQIKNGESLGVNFHLEDTNRPAYTYAGFVAGRSSDVVIWRGGETPRAASMAIDGWFIAPFHRFPLLNTHLEEAGYGEYCEGDICAAALNITTGGVSPSLAYHRRIVASGSFTSQEYGSTVMDTAIEFPPDGSTVHLSRFDGTEWPDPLTSCNGYKPPTGLPISVQIGSWVKAVLGGASVTVNGTSVPACGIDTTNYVNPDPRTQEIGRNGLLEAGAVIIIPRTALPPGGVCKVSAIVNGQQYNWSFTVEGGDKRL